MIDDKINPMECKDLNGEINIVINKYINTKVIFFFKNFIINGCFFDYYFIIILITDKFDNLILKFVRNYLQPEKLYIFIPTTSQVVKKHAYVNEKNYFFDLSSIFSFIYKKHLHPIGDLQIPSQVNCHKSPHPGTLLQL